MINDILTAAGVPHRQGRFTSPPADTYAVYFDDLDHDGPDPVKPSTAAGLPRVREHNVMVEVYEPKPDPKTEESIEEALNAKGLLWSKQDRYWLQDVQRYQVIYEFSYIDKEGGTTT